jgi:hypothetical protein
VQYLHAIHIVQQDPQENETHHGKRECGSQDDESTFVGAHFGQYKSLGLHFSMTSKGKSSSVETLNITMIRKRAVQ